jgi:plasmid stabilization system protein ParE
MKQRLVVTTPEADEDARRIDQWWMQNRGAAPNLFIEELADALALLGMEAGIGVRQPNRAIPGLRRYLLRSTRYHLYFVHSDDAVVIVGIWGSYAAKHAKVRRPCREHNSGARGDRPRDHPWLRESQWARGHAGGRRAWHRTPAARVRAPLSYVRAPLRIARLRQLRPQVP